MFCKRQSVLCRSNTNPSCMIVLATALLISCFTSLLTIVVVLQASESDNSLLRDSRKRFNIVNEGSTDREMVSDRFTYIGSEVWLYSAYVDTRSGPKINLRLLLLLKASKTMPLLQCQYEANGSYSTANLYELSENHNKQYRGYLASCEISVTTGKYFVRLNNRPTIVEVRPTIIALDDTKFCYEYALCVPPLHGHRYSADYLAQYMQISARLGIQHIFLYVHSFGASANVRAALKPHEDAGYVTLLSWNHTMRPHQVWNYGQILAAQDCLYRNIGVSRLVAFYDLDEFLVAQSAASAFQTNRATIRKLFESQETCGVVIPTGYFPIFNGTMSAESLYASIKMSELDTILTKPLVRPETVFEIGIHHISKFIFEKCKPVVRINEKILLLHHLKECADHPVSSPTFCRHTGEENRFLVPYLINTNTERF